MTELPKVAVIATGGTIDSVGRDRTDLAWYLDNEARLTDGQLLARIPEIAAIATVEQIPFRRIHSFAITDRDWIDLARLVQDAARSDVAGIVITHGTNTLEETAYFLNLVVRSRKPIVLVGAMRPASGMSPDGDLNLFRAIQVAAAPKSAGRGVLVVLNDTILGARDVTKRETYRVNTFGARDTGPLGYADNDGEVVFYHTPDRKHTADSPFSVDNLEEFPPVEIVISHVGARGGLIAAAVEGGARGIVVAGTGPGVPTPSQDEALEVASRSGVVVCLCSRVGGGRVPRGPSTIAKGWVAGDNLQPWKARVLLSLALTKTSEPDEIQELFDAY